MGVIHKGEFNFSGQIAKSTLFFIVLPGSYILDRLEAVPAIGSLGHMADEAAAFENVHEVISPPGR